MSRRDGLLAERPANPSSHRLTDCQLAERGRVPALADAGKCPLIAGPSASQRAPILRWRGPQGGLDAWPTLRALPSPSAPPQRRVEGITPTRAMPSALPSVEAGPAPHHDAQLAWPAMPGAPHRLAVSFAPAAVDQHPAEAACGPVRWPSPSPPHAATSSFGVETSRILRARGGVCAALLKHQASCGPVRCPQLSLSQPTQYAGYCTGSSGVPSVLLHWSQLNSYIAYLRSVPSDAPSALASMPTIMDGRGFGVGELRSGAVCAPLRFKLRDGAESCGLVLRTSCGQCTDDVQGKLTFGHEPRMMLGQPYHDAAATALARCRLAQGRPHLRLCRSR